MFNKIRTIGKIAKTVSSPITHARNIIKSKFSKTGPTIKSVKPKATSDASKRFKARVAGVKLGVKEGTDQFQKQNPKSLVTDKQIKKVQKDTSEKHMKKVRKEYLRAPKRTGGRIGLKGGGFPDHSGDGKITQKDILMAKGVIPKTKNKNKKKVI